MADSVYRVTEVIGVSSESWEAAARNAVEVAAKSVRDLRVAEVVREDVTIENGSISAYRVRLADLVQVRDGRLDLPLGPARRGRRPTGRARSVSRLLASSPAVGEREEPLADDERPRDLRRVARERMLGAAALGGRRSRDAVADGAEERRGAAVTVGAHGHHREVGRPATTGRRGGRTRRRAEAVGERLRWSRDGLGRVVTSNSETCVPVAGPRRSRPPDAEQQVRRRAGAGRPSSRGSSARPTTAAPPGRRGRGCTAGRSGGT